MIFEQGGWRERSLSAGYDGEKKMGNAEKGGIKYSEDRSGR